jgi:hypothetical protein
MTHLSLLQTLWQSVEDDPKLCVYSVQDAAANERIYPNLKAASQDSACLYAGDIPETLAEAAPHVIRLLRSSPYTPWLLRESFGGAWGIFLHSHATLQALRLHLHRLLHVTDDHGKSHLFRYFDPRVLRMHLPAFSPQELRAFFGPVQTFFAESESGDSLIAFSLQGQTLQIRILALAEAGAAAGTP